MSVKEYKPIPRFNDHGSTCKMHANSMLDCEYRTREERDLMVRVIDNYLPKNEAMDNKGSRPEVLNPHQESGPEVQAVQPPAIG